MTTNRDDMPNESYDLAETYVCDRIRILLAGETAEVGLRLRVDGLEGCDCVPVILLSGPGGKWDLVEVYRSRTWSLLATYEAR